MDQRIPGEFNSVTVCGTGSLAMRKIVYADRFHSERVPHWSLRVRWRPGRWDPMANAPCEGGVLEVRGRDAKGVILESMHFACDLSGEYQLPFKGWFVKRSWGYSQVYPVEWQPLHASPTE